MSTINFDEIAEAISPEQLAQAIGARPSRSPGMYHCPCPAHENDDNKASLSINRKNGRTVVNRFVCDIKGTPVHEVPPVAVPLPMLDPEPSVVPGVGAS